MVFCYSDWIRSHRDLGLNLKSPLNSSFNPLEVTSVGRGRGFQQWWEVQQQWPSTSLSTPLWSEAVIWKTESFLPSLLEAVCKLLQKQVHICLPWSKKVEMSSWYYAKTWSGEKWTTIYHLILSPEVASLQKTPRFQNSYIKLILPV